MRDVMDGFGFQIRVLGKGRAGFLHIQMDARLGLGLDFKAKGREDIVVFFDFAFVVRGQDKTHGGPPQKFLVRSYLL